MFSCFFLISILANKIAFSKYGQTKNRKDRKDLFRQAYGRQRVYVLPLLL